MSKLLEAHFALLVVNLLCAGALFALAWQITRERIHVRSFALRATRRTVTPRDAARALGQTIFESIQRRDDDPPFIHATLSAVGATPSAVLRDGACCSGIARLYILSLDAIGIPAVQVTLYHTSGHAEHCLTEVVTGETRQLIDPTYGLLFETLDGRPLSLTDLRGGRRPRLVSLVTGVEAAYPPSDYYAFDYPATKTANWTRTWPRRSAYSVLRRVIDVDHLRLPVALEWPHVIVGSVLVFCAVTVNALSSVL